MERNRPAIAGQSLYLSRDVCILGTICTCTNDMMSWWYRTHEHEQGNDHKQYYNPDCV